MHLLTAIAAKSVAAKQSFVNTRSWPVADGQLFYAYDSLCCNASIES
jgi:hypothetical protein